MVNGGERMSEEKGQLPFVYSEEYVDKQLRSINKM